MDKIIEIDLFNEEDLFERYNRKVVSKDLIDYIVKKIMQSGTKTKFKVIINNNINKDECINLIKKKIEEEYKINTIRHKRNSYVQLIYLFFGLIALSLSNLIDSTIFKEIILISGWVLIWTMVEVELFSDMEIRKRQKILKKLLNSKFIENKFI